MRAANLLIGLMLVVFGCVVVDDASQARAEAAVYHYKWTEHAKLAPCPNIGIGSMESLDRVLRRQQRLIGLQQLVGAVIIALGGYRMHHARVFERLRPAQ